MFRLIFFTQAIVYLLLMPAVHGYLNPFYHPPLFISIIAIIFLMIGFAAPNFFKVAKSDNKFPYHTTGINELRPRTSVPIGFAFLAIIYAYVSLSNGLWNRRQGSEVMAEIYGNLPLIDLVILRIYEIAFIPVSVIYLFGKTSRTSRIFIVLTLVASLPFMGVEDSRGRILVISIALLSFVKITSLQSLIQKNSKIFVLMVLAIAAFFYASSRRANSYARVEDYFFDQVVRRLDGLNLVAELRDFNLLHYLGSFDFAMLAPLVSRIPFIEAGRIAKVEGITSTKQYFLKNLLNTSRIDDSNSMILDPMYFGGFIGLAVAFAFLGYFIAIFDRYIKEEKLFSNYLGLALLLSFINGFSLIEVDYFGAITTFIQNFIILFPALCLMLYKPHRLPPH